MHRQHIALCKQLFAARRRKVAIAGLLAATALPAWAQGFPSKPMRVVVPQPPGGGFDVVGRLLAPRVSEILGQQIVVENKPGATGNIGTAMLSLEEFAPGRHYVIECSSYQIDLAPSIAPKSVAPSGPSMPTQRIVYFDFDSSAIKSSEQSKVSNVADYLKANAFTLNQPETVLVTTKWTKQADARYLFDGWVFKSSFR